jgi:hypothetical protein
LDKAPELFKAIDGSTDIGKKIENFIGKDDDKEKESKNTEDKKPSKN